MLGLGLGITRVRSSGAAPAFSPSSLTPLAWYDVADLTTLFQERTAGGTTPGVVGGVVGTVRDKSGNGYNLQSPTDAARPILRTTGARYWLEFDGTDDAMRAAFTVGTTWSRYGAQRVVTYVASDRIYCGGANDRGDVNMGSATGTIRHVVNPNVATPATGTDYTLAEDIAGTAGTFSVNGAAPASAGTITATSPGGLTVGAYWNGTVHAAYGAILWYGCTMRVAAFSAGDLTNLEAYYRAKAGL